MALAVRTKPRVLLLDEPLRLAAAERGPGRRVGSAGVRRRAVLLVEHYIDRVFSLADAVTG